VAHLASYFLPDKLDPHTWDREYAPEPCRLFVDGRTCNEIHGMVCSKCGLRHYGPFRGPNSEHFFTYEHPDGQAHELMPPCTVQAVNAEVEIRDVTVCAVCQSIIMNPKLDCRFGHCDHRNETRVLRACVLVNAARKEGISCHP
jgi:hypothetical protein